MALFSKKKAVDEEALAKEEEKARAKAAKEAAAKEKAKAEKEERWEKEGKYLIDRKYNCPVCGTAFTSKAVKSNVSRQLGFDMDLRPRYEQLDNVKYGVVLCPECGYATLATTFKDAVFDNQKDMINKKITPAFKQLAYKEPAEKYTYNDALVRYKQAAQLCLALPDIKASKKANTCLRMGWIIRGQQEELDEEAAGYQKQLAALKAVGFSASSSANFCEVS